MSSYPSLGSKVTMLLSFIGAPEPCGKCFGFRAQTAVLVLRSDDLGFKDFKMEGNPEIVQRF